MSAACGLAWCCALTLVELAAVRSFVDPLLELTDLVAALAPEGFFFATDIPHSSLDYCSLEFTDGLYCRSSMS